MRSWGRGHSGGQDPAVVSAGELFCRRFVLTIRTEVTDRMLIFGERHLRRVLAGYGAHYNTARPHRALRLRRPRPTSPVPEPVHGRIRRRPILGGLLNEYEAAA
jgi:putative transposase